jgi:hypothetical protein
MSENHDLLKCPLCEGQGKVRGKDLLEFFSDPELKARIEAFLAQFVAQVPEDKELVGAGAQKERNFQKDVHCWNAQFPMWRRSPKE